MLWLVVWAEGFSPLVLFEKDTLHHHQESTACCSTIQKESIWKQLDLPIRQRNSIYSSRNARVIFPSFIDKDT